MVFFSCDGCGDTLKKNQVDGHVHRCRVGCEAVSCVDCSVSFPGDDYRSHTSCISEAERYEKSVFRGPKKGELNKSSKKMTPQEAWMHLISMAAETAPPPIRSNMEQLATLDNVPRKEKQFRNFTANSLRLRGRDALLVDSMWEHLSKLRREEQRKREQQQNKQDKQKNNESAPDVVEAHDRATESGSKQDAENEGKDEGVGGESIANSTKSNLDSKAVKKTMKMLLKKAPQRKMKVKKLRREVQAKLMLKGVEKELKKMVSQHIGASGKTMRLDGKVVILL